jgi:hypothetical protein
MTKRGSFSILAAAMMVGLGAGQAIAAPSHSSPGHTGGFREHSRAKEAYTGDDHWLPPNCLQPNVLVQTSRGMAWEPKAQCTY